MTVNIADACMIRVGLGTNYVCVWGGGGGGGGQWPNGSLPSPRTLNLLNWRFEPKDTLINHGTGTWYSVSGGFVMTEKMLTRT